MIIWHVSKNSSIMQEKHKQLNIAVSAVLWSYIHSCVSCMHYYCQNIAYAAESDETADNGVYQLYDTKKKNQQITIAPGFTLSASESLIF